MQPAQIAYIEKRSYPIAYIEMGEEPDGKHAIPEDYGALYLQWAAAIHKVDPRLKLGGPVFEGVNEDIRVWPDAQGRTSWMGRFVAYFEEPTTGSATWPSSPMSTTLFSVAMTPGKICTASRN